MEFFSNCALATYPEKLNSCYFDENIKLDFFLAEYLL